MKLRRQTGAEGTMESFTSTTIKQRILVVEDDSRMLELICKGLRESGHTPMPASDGDEGLSLAMSLDFDSIILDIGLPGRDGYSVARSLREKKRVPILMLTARDSEDDVLRGFDTGADDYLTKPFSFREMLARLNVIGRISQQRNHAMVLDSTRLIVHREGDAIQLTRSEFRLLTLLHLRRGTTVERKVLIEAVWASLQTVPANALDVLVNSLRGKVDAPYEEKIIRTVRGVGYRLQIDRAIAQQSSTRQDA